MYAHAYIRTLHISAYAYYNVRIHTCFFFTGVVDQSEFLKFMIELQQQEIESYHQVTHCRNSKLQQHCNNIATTLQQHCNILQYRCNTVNSNCKQKEQTATTLQYDCNNTATTLHQHCNLLQYHCNTVNKTCKLQPAVCMYRREHTLWRRVVGSLIFIGHFPQKSPIISN